jgi:DNA polymerase III delta prime subunit
MLDIQALHPKIKNLIDSVIENKRLANAYLFYGENPALNETLALYLIKSYQKRPLENNPDLCIVDAEKSIKIDDIRRIQEQCKYGPSSSNTLFVLIKDVEKITQEAANAFLKTLESPPKGVSIILLSNSLQKLIPTIQSRCQKCFIPNTKQTSPHTALETYETLQNFIQSPTQKKFSFIDSISKDKPAIKALLYAWIEESILTMPHNTELLSQAIKRFEYHVNTKLQLESLALKLH